MAKMTWSLCKGCGGEVELGYQGERCYRSGCPDENWLRGRAVQYDLFQEEKVAKRGRMAYGHSKSQFRSGTRVHKKNFVTPGRGGYRL